MREKIKLGEIIDTIQGSQYSLDEQITENKEGYLRFLRISDYTKADEPIRYVKYTGKELVCNEDEVVVVRYGNVGFIGYGKKGILANNLFVLRLKNKSFDSKYLYYYLNSPNINNAIVNKANSSTMPALTHKMIKELEIPVVDIEEQKSIVSRLNKIQKIIDIRKEQIEYLDELIKSQFVEMFGDPILNNKNWKINKWNEVLTIKNGKNQKKVEQEDGKYPIYGSGGIMSYANNYICNEDSVIIGRKGNINNPILVRTKFWNVDTAFGLEPCKEKIIVEYLYFFCYFYNFEKHNKAVTIPSLTKTDLLNIDIPIPQIELQKRFADFVKQIDKQKFEIQKSLEKMQNLYESIMDNYFGE